MGFENESIDSRNNEMLQDSIEVKKEYHDIIENLYYEELDAIMLTEEKDISQKKANKFLITRQGNPLIPREIEKETGFQAYVTNLVVLRNKKVEPFLKKGILVDNIQNGIKIFKKYAVDVVTQNAEIINKDGLIIRKRGKGILNVIDEIKKINIKKTELEKRLQVSGQRLKQEQIKYQDLKETVEKEKNSLSNLKEKYIQVDAKLNEVKKNRGTYLNRVKLNESELELLALEKEKNHIELQKSKKQRALHEKEHQTSEKKQKEFEANVQELEGDVNQKEKNVLQKDSRINLLNEKLTSTRTKLRELEANKLKLSNQNNLNLKEISKLEKELSETDQKIKNIEKDTLNLNLNKDTMEKQTKNLDQEFENVNEELKAITADLKQKRKTLDEIKENRSKMEIDFSSIKKDIFQLQDSAFKELNTELDQIDEQEGLQHMDVSALETQYQTSNERMIKMRDSDRLNFSAESEYEILSKDHHFLLSQKEDIEKSITDMNNAIKKIDEESQISFLKAFKEITKNYQKNFQILFEGGEAELMLTDADNITETGLEIKAQPPGKRLQSLRLLSGGEKALTSLAFLFALFEYKPSPFCVFDEVDASLDEANVQRFLKFVHKLKERTQFLIITHNFKTMEEADYIYGITMNEPGISTIYSMKMTGKNQLVPEDRS
jgi:chromosome segregation protein